MTGESRPPERGRALRLHFEDGSQFAAEFRRNISLGGAFVPCTPDFELRESVRVALDLVYCGKVVELDAEVVNVVSLETVAAGATVGVAVQFTMDARELRDLLAPHLSAAASPPAQEAEKDEEGEASLFGDVEFDLDDDLFFEGNDPDFDVAEDSPGAATPPPLESRDPDEQLSPIARLRVDPACAIAGPEGLTNTEQAVLDLAAARLSVRRVLDVIPEPEDVVLRAIQSLCQRGVLSTD